MQTLKKLFSRHFYRSIPFWLLSLLSLYSLLGFIVLPKVIHNTINEQVSQYLGWQTRIEKVELNPFLLTLTINELAILEADKAALSFSRFHADFELRSVIEGAYTFKNIALIDPYFHLSIDENGNNNIQQALAAHPQPEKEAIAKEEDTATSMPKLLFDNISVENGQLSAHDLSRGDMIQHQLNPISFELNSFSTYVKKGGDYQLHISLGDNQSIDWKGRIAVSPIASQGSLKLTGIKIEKFWPYLKQYSPYELRHSETALQANYALSYLDDNLQLQIDDGFVTINDIQLADALKPDAFLDIKQIKVGPTQFDLAKQSVSIADIAIDAINLDIIRDKAGALEFLAPLETFLANSTPQDEHSEPVEAQESSPFLWSIDTFSVSNSDVKIIDNGVKGGSEINVHGINATLEALNQSLSNQQPFSLAYHIEQSPLNRLSGELTAQPFNLQSNVIIDALPLNIVQPYLAEVAKVTVKDGALSVQGKLNLATDAEAPLTGDFNGTININAFETVDNINKQRLLGWQQLSLSPLSVNFNPLSIDINKVNIDSPYSRLVISEDRQINFSQLMIEQPAPATKPAPTQVSTDPASAITIAEIAITDGNAYFADLSLRPQFGTGIQQLNGTIKGLSSGNLEAADVDIKGRIEEYGKMAIVGEINPLSGELSTDINVSFDQIELTTMTPYSGRYAGYVIDKGKLSLDLNYKIANGLLDGTNRLILDQFELGKSVESEESLDLPIKLALALFKDSNGIIDIDLPTKGDMNSPDFEIGGIVMKALLNVITKAVTSPFSLLANLAGGDEQSLNASAFELGSATLTASQKENIKTLASFLIERPQLILEVRVNVDRVKETLLLQQQALTTTLDLNNKNQQQRLTAMEALFIEKQGEHSVQSFKDQLLTAQDPQQEVDESIFNQQYQQALFDHLVLLQPIASLQLSELAQQRISSIKNELINVNQVKDKQIFALQPSLSANAEDDVINTTFSLTSK